MAKKTPWFTFVMLLAVLPSFSLNSLDMMEPIISPDKGPRDEAVLKLHLQRYHENPNDPAIWLDLGQDYLSLASSKNWHYLDHAATYLDKVITRFPKMAVALMLRGRVEGARALDESPSSLTRLRWARNGFKQMDVAVKLAPDDFYLRLLRGEAGLMAHPILRRADALKTDVAAVATYLKTGVETPPWMLARIHLFLGNYYQRQKQSVEARDHWQQATQLASGSNLGLEADLRLKGTFRSMGFED